MSRIALRWLLLLPVLALAQQGPTAPVALQGDGKVLVRAGGSGAEVRSWSLRLPNPVRAIHVAGDDFILLQEGDRFRFMAGGPPDSETTALLRTMPRQLTQSSFKHASSDGGSLVFETAASREEINIRALRDGHFSSVVTRQGASPSRISEPLLTPVTRLFWKPTRPGHVGPGQGKRADVIAAFSKPRANESIEEYEPFDCPFPLHAEQPNGPWIWVPTRTRVYEHSLHDRDGNKLVFFTALESGDVTYFSEPEATARGCEASYRRIRGTAPQSYDASLKPGKDEHVFQVELLDQGVPAEGVMVRTRETSEAEDPSCVISGIGNLPNLNHEDGLTLADGSYAWKRFRSRQQARGGRRGIFSLVDRPIVARLCIRMDGKWLPIWLSPRERGNYHVRCDLAVPASQRCTRIG
jgi:hypothetical protein